MSAFYIGQRVRIVRIDNYKFKYLLGAEAMIIDHAPADWCSSDWLLNIRSSRGIYVGVHSSGIEPILPPGLESLDRINELYEPEPEVIKI